MGPTLGLWHNYCFIMLWLEVLTPNLSFVESGNVNIVSPAVISFFNNNACNCDIGIHESWTSPNKATPNIPVTSKASGGLTLTIIVTQNVGPAACTSCPLYNCLFYGASGNSLSAPAVGGQVSGLSTTYNCTVPNWGASYPMEPVQVSLYKGNILMANDGNPFVLYLEEEIFAASQTLLDAAGASVTITGSGFRADAGAYQCFLFGPDMGQPGATPSTSWPRWAPQQPVTAVGGLGFPGLVGAPFVASSTTSGSCVVAWPYEATPAFLTLLHSSPAFDELQATDRERERARQRDRETERERQEK